MISASPPARSERSRGAALKRQVRRLLSTPVKLLLANGGNAVIGLLSSILLARILGPEGRGILAGIIAWPLALAAAGLFGVHLLAARRAAIFPAHRARIYSESLITLVPGFLVASAVMSLFGSVLQPISSSVVTAASVLLIAGSMLNALQLQVELSANSILASVGARVAFSLLFLLGIVALAIAGKHEPTVYFLAMVVAALIAPIVTAILSAIDRAAGTTGRPLERLGFKAFLHRALPDGLATLSHAATAQADRLLIAAMMPAALLGYYVAALAIAQIQNLISETMAQLFFARTAQRVGDTAWLAKRLRQSLVVNLLAAIVVLAASPLLVPLLFGDAFRPAVPLVLLLIPALALIAARRPMEEALKGAGHSLHQTRAQICALATFLVLGVPSALAENIYMVACSLFLAGFVGLTSAILSTRTIFGIAPIVLFRPKVQWSHGSD